jgi:aspartate aminotransferase-like enzyme
MFRKTRLFTPGPTPLLPDAQFAMAAMEAAVSNLTSPGDEVLVLTAGKFGERWTSLAKAFGCNPKVVSVPYGETFTLEQVRSQLSPQTRVVYMQATETSTGTRHDVAQIGALLKGSDTLLVVDAITGLGTTALDPDAPGIGIDIIIGGSQKALMIPPGLAYLAASERAWKRMETTKQPRYYFDLQKERKSAAKGESAYTPAVALIAAMGAALDYLTAQGDGDLVNGRKKLVANAELCAECTRAGVEALGLELFSSSPSAAVTAVKAPAGISATDIVKAFKSDFGGILSDGQGEMKGQLFRIAHIGYLDYLDCIAVITGLEQVLARLGHRKFELGDGLRAAQRAFASRNAQAAGGAR